MKKLLLQASLALLLCLFAFSCGKDEPTDPVDTTGPKINSFSPTTGAVGTTIWITGKNFGATTAANTVKIGNITVPISSASPSEIFVTVPEGAQTGTISVTVDGKTDTAGTFTVTVAEPDPTTVTLDQETLELQTLDTDQLVATVAGAGANETVVWSSDNEEAAVVDQEGNVTATGAGTATITATVDGVGATCSITVNPSIIVGGTVEKNNGDYKVAAYWINGIKTELNDMDSDDVSLDVSGTDIYSTFAEYDTDATYIRVMKNTGLHNTLGGLNDKNKRPNGIEVVGSDVYVCGFEVNNDMLKEAKYWKNGMETILGNGIDISTCTDIAVSDGSVFASVNQFIQGSGQALFWKDGTTTEYNTQDNSWSAANGIFIDDLGDLYTAGQGDLPGIPYVWKNEQELYTLGDLNTGVANALVVKNGNVFVVGENESTNKAALWVNGNLAAQWSGYARAITVLNGTIYVAGSKHDGNINSYTPTVFTFGTISGNLIEEISLPSDGSDGYATSIVIK